MNNPPATPPNSARLQPAVVLVTLLFLWPAIYNGFPLLMADSMTYLASGLPIARALFLHQFSDYYGMRSLLYSLSIFPFHWNVNPWPVAVVQSLAAAWVLWLVVRTFAAHFIVRQYLALASFLSVFTSVAWYTCFLMPDILGPLAYLALFLLFFSRQSLSRIERSGVWLIAYWGITAHSTHLMLAVALLVLFAIFAALERHPSLRSAGALGEIAAVLAVSVITPMALHTYLDGKPSLDGQRPPYLTARVIADGPGRWYLESHCATEHWAACAQFAHFSGDAGDFLWGDNAPYENASEDEKRKLEAQDTPLVLATIRAYPGEELKLSAANFRQQLLAFGLYDFDSGAWTLSQFNEVIPASKLSFERSREGRGVLPLDQLTVLQFWTVIFSLAVIVALTPLSWRRHSRALAGLALVVVSIVVLNAFLTGVLSIVDERYQCRVIWLIPLLAGSFVLDWLEQRTARGRPFRLPLNKGNDPRR